MATNNLDLSDIHNAVEEVVRETRTSRHPSVTTDDEDVLTPKEAIEVIRDFDGKSQSVESFIAEIDEVKRLVPREKQNYFLRLIKAKRIVGTVAREMEAYTTDTYNEFFEALRLMYASTQPVEVWQNSRSRCFQRRNETVTQYANRFLEIQNKVLSCTVNSEESVENKRAYAEYERKQGLRQFILGLRTEYATEVRAQVPKNIRQAIAIAQTSESQQMTREMMMRQLEPQSDRRNISRNAINNRDRKDRPTDRRDIPTCNYCKRLGHLEQECRTKKYHEERSRQTQNFRNAQYPKPPDRVHDIQTDPDTPLEYTLLETEKEQLD
nr:PREDICTED: uncharacterized protein LOC105662010 [Megachile rotundata]